LVGAMKSATSSLHDLLISFPGVQGAERKEIYYFSKKTEWIRGDDYYHSHFSGADDDARYYLDSSASYLVCEDAIDRIRTYRDINGPVKIIVCLRDPISRAISAIQYCRTLLNVEHRGVDQIIAPLLQAGSRSDLIALERAQLVRYRSVGAISPVWGESDCLTHPFAYFTSSMYSYWLEKWRSVFGDESIHLCLFEDVLAGSPILINNLARFLDVEIGVDQSPVIRHMRQTAIYRSKLLQMVAHVGRPFVRKLPKSLRYGLQQNILKSFKEKPVISLNPGHLDMLSDFFSEERGLLSQLKVSAAG